MRISDWSSDVCSSDLGMAFGVARDEAQLAHQILDVVEDEGEASVEFVEPALIGERALRAGLGAIACDLPPGDAQQVEILPVERSADRRVGKECVSKCSSRWSPYHSQN